MSWGRSKTSKTRSNETIEVANSTRALDSAVSGAYSCPSRVENITMVPIVNEPLITSTPPTQNTAAVPRALTIPKDIEPCSPKGFPMATTNWPT